MKKGIVMVVSGPSGCGKGTLVNLLCKEDNICVSISATTRNKRYGEVDGKDYYFLEKDEFLKKLENEGFLEYNEYCGNYYGTLKEEVLSITSSGRDVILEIDVCGMKQINDQSNIVKVFILPPSLRDLKERLKKRGTESDEDIQKRLTRARGEIEEIHNYDYVVINDNLEEAVERLNAIIKAERNKIKNMQEEIEEVINSEFK